MKYGLRVSAAAESDIDEIAMGLARDNLDAALRFCDAVKKTTEKIIEGPHHYQGYPVSPGFSDMRACGVRGFSNYLVFYRIEDDLVWVTRVIHGARDIEEIFSEL